VGIRRVNRRAVIAALEDERASIQAKSALLLLVAVAFEAGLDEQRADLLLEVIEVGGGELDVSRRRRSRGRRLGRARAQRETGQANRNGGGDTPEGACLTSHGHRSAQILSEPRYTGVSPVPFAFS